MIMTKILLIEDALDLAALVRRELEAEGYAVRHAADGQAGLELFAAFAPDLVLLDWMLPKLDGLTVLRRIRQASGPRANVPVLMLTARGEETDRVIGLEVGADDYLTKPFGMRELVARIHALLRRIENIQAVVAADRASASGSEAKPVIAAAEGVTLRLDPSGYEATLDGEPLDLTRTEFDLLALLARNPGRAFSRQYLLDTVWGADYITGDRSVDNAILRLRKKLGALGESVETVWGVGYRWRRQPGAPAQREAGQ
jgi:DNA-binding response OmpR family regulator